MNFFRHFPQVSYTYQTDDVSFALIITNPTVRIKIMEKLKQHVAVIYDYFVREGERPDTVATKLYGSPDYTWIILFLNNIMSLYDWPLTGDEFYNYIVEKYGSVETAQAETVYYTSDGYEVDETTYSELAADKQGSTSTKYDVELEANEDKRKIKVVPAAFVEPLMNELRQILA